MDIDKSITHNFLISNQFFLEDTKCLTKLSIIEKNHYKKVLFCINTLL